MIKNGITLLSAYDPESRCRKAANAVAVRDKTLYLCPSPLYGYGLDTLLANLESCPNSAILCIEADPELYEISFKTNIPADKKLRITNICKIDKLYEFVRKEWGARTFRRVEMVKLTGGWQLFSGLYLSLLDALNQEIANDWSNVLILAKLGRLYIRNLLKNLSIIPNRKSIGELSMGDSSVLVLGAGPSLDKILDNLPEKRDYKIICVDTCIGALKDRNIVPDLVVILESQHWNLRDFVGCKGWNVPAAMDLSALPQSGNILAGQGYIFMTPWTELRVFERLKNANLLPNIISPLGSVGLTAMEIAGRITTGKITHAGMDFSFTIDKSHARGTPAHKHKLNNHNRFGGLLDTAAFGAGIVRDGVNYTNPVMRGYKKLFDKEFGGNSKTASPQKPANKYPPAKEDINNFIKGEIERLQELKDMLSGEKTIQKERLHILINECDYLWAHFPDYAGGASPNYEDLSFLNRIRIEIDYSLILLESLLSA
ncbi:MAG: DUF115 domain-containing protein [Treponema sp.]|nr:DUF115 domain-containing protein [Treponema sp.]